jgi:hypothetical protein
MVLHLSEDFLLVREEVENAGKHIDNRMNKAVTKARATDTTMVNMITSNFDSILSFFFFFLFVAFVIRDFWGFLVFYLLFTIYTKEKISQI